MNEMILQLLEEENNFGVWVLLKKNYEGNFEESVFNMFRKYSYFYDIPLQAMNSIIYYGMHKYNMDSIELEENLHDICKSFQQKQIKTAREGAYLFKLYDLDMIINSDLINRMLDKIKKLEKGITILEK